jgi:hypothetical protein
MRNEERDLFWVSGLFVLALWMIANWALAGTAARLDWPGLVESCDVALHGRVRLVRPQASQGPSRTHAEPLIETHYTIEVLEDLRGVPAPSFTFVQPGGYLAHPGRGTAIPGLRTFAVGEELVLFLTREGPGGWRLPVGLAQGVLRVLRDERGRPALERDTSRLTLLEPGGASGSPGARQSLDFEATMGSLRESFRARLRLESSERAPR